MLLVKTAVRGSLLLPFATALGCLALILFFKHLTWPHDLYLASAFINFYIDPETYSPHDILIVGAREIPFLLYQGFGQLIRWGATLQEICYWGVCICLIMTFLALWKIAFYMTRDAILASLVVFLIALSPGNAGTLMSTPLPNTTFVSSTIVMPLVIFAEYLILCGSAPLALVVSSVILAFHPGYGVITGLITATVLLCEIHSHPVREVLIKGTLAGIVGGLIVVFLIMPTLYHNTGDLSDEQFFQIFKNLSHHSYLNQHWPDEWLKTLCLTILAWHYHDPERSHLGIRIRRIIMSCIALSFIYLIGIYVIESKFIARMFLWRTSIFLKPLSFSCVMLFAFHRMRMTRIHGRTLAGVIVMFCGLMLQSFSHSYQGGLVVLIGLSIAIESKYSVDIGIIITSLLVFIFTSPFSLSIWYLALLLLAPLYLLSRPIAIGSPVLKVQPLTAIIPLSALFFLSQLLQPEQRIEKILLPVTPRESFTEADISHYLSPEETELITWAIENTSEKSVFLVPPRDFLGIKFRSLAKRSIFISMDDVMQLSYASVKTYSAAFNRLQSLGIVFRPYGSMRAYDLIDFPQYSCKSRDVTISTHWIDYVLFSKGDNPLLALSESPAFENKEFVVYNRASIMRSPCNRSDMSNIDVH